jgi:hypothetical protein
MRIQAKASSRLHKLLIQMSPKLTVSLTLGDFIESYRNADRLCTYVRPSYSFVVETGAQSVVEIACFCFRVTDISIVNAVYSELASALFDEHYALK